MSAACSKRIVTCLLAATTAYAQPRVLDRIVAVVDKEIITDSELQSQVEFFIFNNHVDPKTSGLKRQVLEAMMNEKLILAKAVEESVTVTDDEVSQQLNTLIQQRTQQIGSERRLEELYGMPISRIRREFREDMHKQLLVSRLQQTKFSNLQVSRREAEQFYSTYGDSLPKVPEEFELYHIFRLPKASETAKTHARAQANQILDSIRAGGDFAELAKRYSEDPGSASLGGDLGFVRRGQLVNEFEEAAFALKQNEVSKVVETSFGFHVIQLLERRGESIHARHILFKVEQDTTADHSAITFLSSLRDSAVAGTGFADLAKRYSDDQETAPMGGYLGKLTLDQLDQTLLSTVRGMKPGDISDPVRVTFGARYGYHIVLLKERTSEHSMNLNDDWKRVEQIAANFKRSKEYERWINELKKDIYWEIRL